MLSWIALVIFVDGVHLAANQRIFANNFFSNLPNSLFCQLIKMDKQTFFDLLSFFEDHLVFFND